MSSPYIVIPSDSDNESDQTPVPILPTEPVNENNNVPASNSEYEDESDPSENMEEEEHSIPEPTPDNMEIESESEETIPETPVSSPHTEQTSHRTGPRMVRTARKRVAIRHRRVTLSPESSIPSADPYINHSDSTDEFSTNRARNWTWLADTLQDWRAEEGFPSITEIGESSSATQENPLTGEPSHHTVPLLVARVSSMEQRIEHAENNLMDIPGTGTIEDLQFQISNLEHQVGVLQSENEELRQANRASNGKALSVERRMDQFEGSLEKLHTMAAIMGDYAAFILKGNHIPKKD